MKILFLNLAIFLLLFHNSYGQNNDEIFYILDKTAYISSGPKGKLYYLISIKSENGRFSSDGYKFIIPNQVGFDEYKGIKKVRKKISLDSIQFVRKKELEKYTPCDLHLLLSTKKNIFLIRNLNSVFFCYRIIYHGTQKNIEVLQHGF